MRDLSPLPMGLPQLSFAAEHHWVLTLAAAQRGTAVLKVWFSASALLLQEFCMITKPGSRPATSGAMRVTRVSY